MSESGLFAPKLPRSSAQDYTSPGQWQRTSGKDAAYSLMSNAAPPDDEFGPGPLGGGTGDGTAPLGGLRRGPPGVLARARANFRSSIERCFADRFSMSHLPLDDLRSIRNTERPVFTRPWGKADE